MLEGGEPGHRGPERFHRRPAVAQPVEQPPLAGRPLPGRGGVGVLQGTVGVGDVAPAQPVDGVAGCDGRVFRPPGRVERVERVDRQHGPLQPACGRNGDRHSGAARWPAAVESADSLATVSAYSSMALSGTVFLPIGGPGRVPSGGAHARPVRTWVFGGRAAAVRRRSPGRRAPDENSRRTPVRPPAVAGGRRQVADDLSGRVCEP